MNRDEVAQPEPPEATLNPQFPTETPANGLPRYRAHNVANGPWYFSSTANGRFNLGEPNGTCYAADDIETAVRESFGPQTAGGNSVSQETADSLAVSIIALPPDTTYADIGDPIATRLGVTAELSVTPDYDVPQAWAAHFHAGGLNGVRYSSRFTATAGQNSWAVFGEAGPDNTRAVHSSITGREACEQAGLRIRGAAPSSRSLKVVRPMEYFSGR